MTKHTKSQVGGADPPTVDPVKARGRAWWLEPHTWRYKAFVLFRLLGPRAVLADIILLILTLEAHAALSGSSGEGGLPIWVIGLLLLYAVIRLSQIIYHANTWPTAMKRREDLIRTFLAEVHATLFGDASGVRYTLFEPDLYSPEWIVPTARFEYGQEEGSRASKSRARYVRGMGHTGRAWSLPTPQQQDALFWKFPQHFTNREAMTHHYTQVLRIPNSIVKSLSGYMVNVRALYGVHLVGGKGNYDYGVLSVDVTEEMVSRGAKTLPTAQKMKQALEGALLPLLESDRTHRSIYGI